MWFQDKVMLSPRKASMLEFFRVENLLFACQRRRFRKETVIIECWTLITGLLFFLIFRTLEEVLLRIQESENYSDTKTYFFDGRLVFDTFDEIKLEFFVA